MPKVYDWNGSAATQIKKIYDWNGSAAAQVKKGYDWNGTAGSLVYRSSENLTLVPPTSYAATQWTASSNSDLSLGWNSNTIRTANQANAGQSARAYMKLNQAIDMSDYKSVTAHVYNYGYTRAGIEVLASNGSTVAASAFPEWSTNAQWRNISVNVGSLSGNHFIRVVQEASWGDRYVIVDSLKVNL